MRRAHTKSRTGCRTCKTRRIRCDETWPSCKRCTTSGRRCDGPSITQTSSVAVSFAQTWTLTSTVRMRPLPSLWNESEQDTRYVQYFIDCLSRDTPSCGGEFSHWRPLMIQAMHQEIAIRRGVVALSAIIQERTAHGSLEIHGFDTPPQSGRYFFGLRKYGKALASLQQLVRHMGSDKYLVEVALLCGIICIWFEILVRDYLAGLSHLEMCLKIVRNADLVGDIDSEILRAYARMDIQASLYVGIRAPVTVAEEISPIPYIFDSFGQAETCLVEEYARVVHFVRRVTSFYRHHEPGSVPLELIAYTHTLQARLELWKSAFGYSYSCQKAQGSPQTSARASLLLIQYYIAVITASTSIYAEQMAYDQFLHAFTRILILARSSSAAQMSAAATALVGVPIEMGVVYPLYFVATKCRDRVVRQEAIDLLSSAPYPDVVWEAPILAVVSQRAKEIEENGLDESQPIPESKRIHSLGLDIIHESRQVRVEFRRRSNGMDGEWEEWWESLSW
ncbi:putative C6 finger domain protein [Aspergillus floccosus]